MREIDAKDITAAVRQLCLDAAYRLPEDVEQALRDFREAEPSPVGRDVLDVIIKNAEIARDEEVAICQDTGYAVAFVTLGQEVRITGGGLTEAIAEGVRRGYADGYLRKSIVEDPLRRKNTGDNTPPVIHYDVVPGDDLPTWYDDESASPDYNLPIQDFPRTPNASATVRLTYMYKPYCWDEYGPWCWSCDSCHWLLEWCCPVHCCGDTAYCWEHFCTDPSHFTRWP